MNRIISKLKQILENPTTHLITLSILIFDVLLLFSEHIVLIVRFHNLQETCSKKGEHDEESWVAPLELLFQILTIIIVSIFFLELICKIIVYRLKYFNNFTNLFDSVVILAAFISEVGFNAVFGVGAFILPLRIIRLIRLSHAIFEVEEERIHVNDG